MDTHLADMPQTDRPASLRHARVGLPGEDTALFVDPGARFAPQPLARRRHWLLASVAILALGAAGTGFLLSPYNTVYPIDTGRLQIRGRQLVASVGQQAVGLVAPAAKVAQVTGSVSKPVPRPEAVVSASVEDQLREIIALHGGANLAPAAAPAPALPASPPPASVLQTVAEIPGLALGSVPQSPPPVPTVTGGLRPLTAATPSPSFPVPPAFETGAVPVSRPAVLTAQPLPIVPATVVPLTSQAPPEQGAAPPPSPTPGPAVASAGRRPTAGATDVEPALPADGGPAVVAPPRPAALPPDAVAVAAEIRAAPMTSAQQVEVLNVVAQLAIVVRDMRAENASLKARVLSTADRFDTAVADFNRRLALAEAKGAINAAMGAEAHVNTAPNHVVGVVDAEGPAGNASGARFLSPAMILRAQPAGVQTVPPKAAAPIAAPEGARYRVSAASPGLAMLSLLDRSGGEGSQLQVTVGDQVPGYGRVTAIHQRGSSWIVQTDKGPDKGVIQ